MAGNKIAEVFVEVGADTSKLDRTFAQMPQKLGGSIEAARQKVKSEMDAVTRSIDATIARRNLLMKDVQAKKYNFAEDGTYRTRDQAADAYDKMMASIRQMNAAIRSGRGDMDTLAAKLSAVEYAASKARLAQSKLASDIKGVGAASAQMAGASSQVSTATKGIHDGSRNAGLGILMLSQAIDDAQYGFRGIVNNMPGIVMAFGGSSGLAGAVSLAAIAVNQWVKNWEYVTEIIDLGNTKFKTNIATIDTWIDTLNRGTEASKKLKAAEEDRKDALDRTKDSKTAASKAEGSKLGEVVEQFGRQQTFDELAKRQREVLGKPKDAKEDARRKGGLAKMLEDAEKGDSQAISSIRQLTGGKGAFGAALERKMNENPDAENRAYEERQKAQERELQAIKEHNAAVEKAEDEHRQAMKAKVADAAKSLEAVVGQGILGGENRGELTKAIASRLKATGVGDSEANEMAEAIFAKIAESVKGSVAGRMLMGGLSAQDAAAAEAKSLQAKQAEQAKAAAADETKSSAKSEVISSVAEYVRKIQTAGTKDDKMAKAVDKFDKAVDKLNDQVKTESGRTMGRLQRARYNA